ncbi:glycosyltransferase family 4 protein [Nitrosomonas sp. Nm58]|uniref:MraY family glycosyltransferase n=1 Tax=Nitrosomonas sp. Nm58 TaxID=200126 RepID=UPI00089519B8|nr:glycosyltransferase family 4 protein [Nitrosomonas sp. Nm58]SDY26450.1 UDP-N-acetylmuramyl pentapeptide phosphotransferase/UDP-N-acetylglucosamine-1-phosphate transferase [Nitrosomonas sp. Nm58]
MNSGFPYQLLAAPLLSFLLAYLLISWLVKGNALRVLDFPNKRSLHSTPVPRTGGVGLALSILMVWLLFSVSLPPSLWAGFGLLAFISFVDDAMSLSVPVRLLVHIIVTMLFSVTLLLDAHHWGVVVGIGLAMVWMSNLYNFMDGSDGLAGGMALIGFGYYGMAALLAGNTEFAMINFCIMASAGAFLRFNFYPAQIFMGDVGAVPLGFLAAALGMLGWAKGLWSLWLPLLVFSPFIVDATVTLVKRLFQGEKIWQAHRKHYYQRIVQSGFGHRNTALLGYMLMLLAGGSAVWAGRHNFIVQGWLTGVWVCIYLIIMLAFDWYQRHYSTNKQNDCK